MFAFLKRFRRSSRPNAPATPSVDLDAIEAKVARALADQVRERSSRGVTMRVFFRRARHRPWLHVLVLWETETFDQRLSYERHVEVRDGLNERFRDEPDTLLPVYLVVRPERDLKDVAPEGFREVEMVASAS